MNGAGNKIRTRDLLITNQLLYQLSYAGTRGNMLKNRDGCNQKMPINCNYFKYSHKPC